VTSILAAWNGMAQRRRVTDTCWYCGATQTRDGFVGYGVGFFCAGCQVGWAVMVERR
jgi:hypothetical protein